MNRLPPVKAFIVFLCVIVATTCQAREQKSDTSSLNTPATLTPCHDCPAFVLTPRPQNGLRKIRYVSKYELTWKSYLASVDAHACPVPSVGMVRFGAAPRQYAQIDPANYRLDWPISQLTPVDVDCYLRWLQSKTKYKVALPSAKEWEWFARAGNPAARFPWGNDAGAGHEHLYGTPLNDGDLAEPAKMGVGLPGRRIGRFAPNPWGIHDLMGNVRELTADVISGEECASRSPDGRPTTQQHPCVVIKGSDAWSRQWARDGIARDLYAIIWNGKYSTDVGVRIVLIEGNTIE